MSQPQVIKVDCEARVLWKEKVKSKGQGTNHPRIHKGVLGKGVGAGATKEEQESPGGRWEEKLFQAEEGVSRAVRVRGGLCGSRRDTRQVT